MALQEDEVAVLNARADVELQALNRAVVELACGLRRNSVEPVGDERNQVLVAERNAIGLDDKAVGQRLKRSLTPVAVAVRHEGRLNVAKHLPVRVRGQNGKAV